MKDELRQLRGRMDRLLGERDQTRRNLDQTQQKARVQSREVQRVQRAQEIVREVALQTQQELQYHIGSVVTDAQAAVFDDPYSMIVRFEQRRGKTECDLWFGREEELFNPLYSGLGAVDVAAFALRVVSWSIARQPMRNILLLDEPFKHLKGAAQNRRAIALMHQISRELGLQIITVSDERAPREDIVEGADRLLEVYKDDGVSRVQSVI